MKINNKNLSIARICGNPPTEGNGDISSLKVTGTKTIAACKHSMFTVTTVDPDPNFTTVYVDPKRAEAVAPFHVAALEYNATMLPAVATAGFESKQISDAIAEHVSYFDLALLRGALQELEALAETEGVAVRIEFVRTAEVNSLRYTTKCHRTGQFITAHIANCKSVNYPA